MSHHHRHSQGEDTRAIGAAGDDALHDRVAALESLPASPALLVELRSMIASRSGGAAEVAALIQRDPALVAMIMRLVRSAYHRLPKLADLKMAVAYLGLDQIYRIVVAASVVNAFRGVDTMALRRHWRAAHVAAILTRDICRTRARTLSQAEGWMLGLLHDVGGLVRMVISPEEAAEVEAARVAGMILGEDAERALQVAPSTGLGATLCRVWGLPSVIEVACAHHRFGSAPADVPADARAYVPIVGAAALLAELVTRALADDVVVAIHDRVRQLIGVDDDGFWSLVADARDALVQADAEVERSLAPRN